MTEKKKEQEITTVRVSVSIIVPEMPDAMIVDFRHRIKVVVEDFPNVLFELRVSDTLDALTR